MANKHMKQYPKSLSLENAIKITVRHHLTTFRVAVTMKINITSTGQDMGKLGAPYTAAVLGVRNGAAAVENQFEGSSKGQ